MIPGLVDDVVAHHIIPMCDDYFIARRVCRTWSAIATRLIRSAKVIDDAFDICSFPNLQSIETGSYYTSFKLSTFTQLTALDIMGNQSDLSGLTNLTSLMCWDNESELSGLTNLTTLEFTENGSNISGLTNLTSLSFWENESNISGLTNLTTLVGARIDKNAFPLLVDYRTCPFMGIRICQVDN